MNCPFCDLESERLWLKEGIAIAIRDNFLLTPGHSLVIPEKHVESIYDLPEAEQIELWRLVGKVHALLKSEFQPDGFNIGVNDGEAAGQTVMHAHIHVIPRREKDVEDPRGGVRCVIPEKVHYWN